MSSERIKRTDLCISLLFGTYDTNTCVKEIYVSVSGFRLADFVNFTIKYDFRKQIIKILYFKVILRSPDILYVSQDK
jgi:hypothetical protein